MTDSETSLRQEEALEQISYLKKIIDGTRVRTANRYPFFFLWGAIWIIGFGAGTWIKNWEYGLFWGILDIAGFIITYIMRNIRRGLSNNTMIMKQISMLNWILAGAAILFFPLVIINLGERIISLYWAFWVGVIYIANSVFIYNKMAIIGSLLVAGSLVALIIPMPYFYFWLSLCGLTFILTGFIFMKQAKSNEQH